VIVYHGNGCHVCHEEMEYLRLKGIPFVAKNVHTNPEARKELIALGAKQQSLKANVFFGFEAERTKELIGTD
jgi:arsenate reductase-like glutaredoxin family protein